MPAVIKEAVINQEYCFGKPTVKSVNVKLDNGEKIHLFNFYPDEIAFTSDELIGLTVDEAKALRHSKDVAYLKS